jgi:hypothetical protein
MWRRLSGSFVIARKRTSYCSGTPAFRQRFENLFASLQESLIVALRAAAVAADGEIRIERKRALNSGPRLIDPT